MMDYMSYFSVPGIDECKRDVINYIKNNNDKINFSKINEELIRKECDKYFENNTPHCSLAGWYSFGIKDCAKEVEKMFINKKTRLRKLRSILKTCVYMFLWYKETIEKRYIPGGVFEREMSLIWNPIINNNYV